MKNLLKSYIRLFLLSVLLFSCGGGGDGTQMASGGIGGTGISKGPITAFGSIFVNGVKFDTIDATVTIDGQTASDTDLKLGMFVTVKGLIDSDGLNGQALTVEFDKDIEGPIDSIDRANNRLVVMGQTVIVDAATQFDNIGGLSDLDENDVVKVSGLFAAGSAIQATLIVKSDPFIPGKTEVELKGLIENLNTEKKTFLIGTQQVEYSSGPTFDDMTESDLVEGLFVEVEGTLDLLNVLNATRIEKKEGAPEVEEGVQLEIEGFVTSFTSPSLFSVSGQAVETTSATTFKDGTAADIEEGVRLEVEGIVNASGVLVAEKIEFED